MAVRGCARQSIDRTAVAEAAARVPPASGLMTTICNNSHHARKAFS